MEETVGMALIIWNHALTINVRRCDE